MTPLVAREASPQELERWDECLASFPCHRVFHKKAWIESIKAFSGAEPVFLVLENGDTIVGLCPGFLVRIGGLRLFVSPREGWQAGSMGVLLQDSTISTMAAFESLVEYLERQHGVQHIELICRAVDPDGIENLGFVVEPVFTQVAPLCPGDEARALVNLPQKTRNQLRKAQKLGLVARVTLADTFVDEFYEQARLAFTRNRAAIPFTRDRVWQLFRFMRDSGNLLPIAVHHPERNACIATGIFLKDESEMYLWGWAHRAEYGSCCPMELLTWTAMQTGMAAGCKSLDMAGGGKAKEKYGAVPDYATKRYVRSRYRWLRWMRAGVKAVYRWQQSLRGRAAAIANGSARRLRPSSTVWSAGSSPEVQR